MKLKIALFVLMAAGPGFLFAQTPAPAVPVSEVERSDTTQRSDEPAPIVGDPDIIAKAENTGAKIAVLLVNIDTDGLTELQRKLRMLKAVQKEISEETRLRLEIIEEFRKVQYGLKTLSLKPVQYDGGKAIKLDTLERIDTIVSAAAKATEDTLRAKVSLGAFRAALTAFRADNNGLFPENPATELPGKHLQSIPGIRLPGHGAAADSIDIVRGVKNSEELFDRVNDIGNWLYVGDKTSPIQGTLIFNCNHKDYDGTAMYRY